MPDWDTLLWVVFGIVMSVITLGGIGLIGFMRSENRLYSAEQKRWPVLAQSGVPAEATVQRFRIHTGNMTRGGSAGQTVCAVVIDVDYADADGARHSATIRTYIEDALLPSFVQPHRVILLRYDPNDPSSVAIDRALTPLEIPRG